MRDIAVGGAVQVAPAHVERVQPERAGNVAQDGFRHDHALRPAKAAKRGVALGMGFQAQRCDVNVLQKISVVHVKDGPVRHRARQVGAEAAVHRHLQLQTGDAPGGVKPHGVVVGKRVALAGDQEVVVPVQPQLDGFFEFVRRHCRPHRHVARLRFLAAKAAAQAPAFHPHRVVGNAQRVGDPVLRLARMLGAAVNEPLVLLLGQHVGNLPFQVKVFLAADRQRAMQRVRRARQGGCRVAPLDHHRRQHIAFRGQSAGHAEQGGQGRDVAGDAPGSAAGSHHRGGHHQANHLANMLHGAVGKHRFVMRKRAQHRVTRNVARQHNACDTGHCQRSVGVHRGQQPMRNGRQNRRGKQRALDFRDVVHERGSALHLGAGALMGAGNAGSATGKDASRWAAGWAHSNGGGCGLWSEGCVHAALSKLHDARLIACRPWLSSQ